MKQNLVREIERERGGAGGGGGGGGREREGEKHEHVHKQCTNKYFRQTAWYSYLQLRHVGCGMMSGSWQTTRITLYCQCWTSHFLIQP